MRLVQVRHPVTHLLKVLGQDAGSHAVLPLTQINQHQGGVVRCIELWGERAAHVLQRGKTAHDQRNRRSDFLLHIAILPLGAHGEGIFPHRNTDAQSRAQLHADGLDRGIQRSIFTGLATGSHPVGRQLHARQLDGGGQQIGNGFGHCHTARSRSVQRGQRGAFAHGHGFTGKTLEIGQRHGAIGHRHLPRADHLVTVRQTTHSAVANGDQEAL